MNETLNPSTQDTIETQNNSTPYSLHTPGPWKTCGANKDQCRCCQIWSVTADLPVAIASIGKIGDDYPSIRFADGDSPGTIGAKVEAYMEQITYWEVPEEQAFANARLIAAAPELLAAGREALSLLEKLMPMAPDRDYDALRLTRAAIAKAEGASSVQGGNEVR